MTMTAPKQWKIGDRVQDDEGFTGTVDDQWDYMVSVAWDISGCISDLKASDVEAMAPGQDDPQRQRDVHHRVFGD